MVIITGIDVNAIQDMITKEKKTIFERVQNLIRGNREPLYSEGRTCMRKNENKLQGYKATRLQLRPIIGDAARLERDVGKCVNSYTSLLHYGSSLKVVTL
jgi:hypothetical protein